MKIVTSSFRLSLLAVVGFAVGTVVLNSGGVQYAELHETISNFGIAAYVLNNWGSPTFGTPVVIEILFGVVKIIEFSLYAIFLTLGSVLAQNIPLRNGQISVNTDTAQVTIAHYNDSRINYDENIFSTVLPILLITVVLGYLTQFVTWLFIWLVASLITWVVLELLTSSSVASTQVNSSSNGSNGSGSPTVNNNSSVAKNTIANASSNVTSVFIRSSNAECPSCETSLEQYDEPEYCPDCGSSLN